jgi:hypothetical protein
MLIFVYLFLFLISATGFGSSSDYDCIEEEELIPQIDGLEGSPDAEGKCFSFVLFQII